MSIFLAWMTFLEKCVSVIVCARVMTEGRCDEFQSFGDFRQCARVADKSNKPQKKFALVQNLEYV